LVHHRAGHRVGPERQPADRIELQLGSGCEHHATHEWRRLGIECDASQVDVVVGRLT
jgi:hypothetical protein